MLKLKFEPERITKNTIRFNEQVSTVTESPSIGILYVQKAALNKIGYKEGDSIVVTIDRG